MTMKNKFFIYGVFLAIPFLTACGNKAAKHDDHEDAVVKTDSTSTEKHEDENLATFTKEQMKTIGIEVGPIENKELNNTIKVNGQLIVPNRYKALITPMFNGVIKSLSIHEGDKVRKGQVVAIISNPDLLQMQQRLQEVNAQIKMSELEVARQKQLVEGNAAPLKRLQQTETELATLKSQRTGLQKQLGGIGASQNYSSSIAVRAPVSGTISKMTTELGSNVDMATPIAEVVDNSQLHLHIFAYEKDLPFIKVGQDIHFNLTNNPGVEYDAVVHTIGSSFEGDTRTVPIHAKIKGNKFGLIDGMSAIAVISLDKFETAAVPEGAIVSHKGQDFIFVVTNKEAEHEHEHAPGEKHEESGVENEMTFEKIPVVKGVSDLGYVQITALKPIAPGSKIVTKNAFFVMAKLTNTGEEGHAH